MQLRANKRNWALFFDQKTSRSDWASMACDPLNEACRHSRRLAVTSRQTQTLMKHTAGSRSFSQGDHEDESKVKHPRSDSKAPLTLPVTPPLYDAPFPFYRRPAEMGRFSLDAKRCFHGDARQLRYYAPPPSEGPSPGFDLRDGYRDRYVQRDDSIQSS
ncbi:hypothetical protein E2320_014544 [Naja naja]|nr:hypothetical protein E2320_014544 [Naja naja]